MQKRWWKFAAVILLIYTFTAGLLTKIPNRWNNALRRSPKRTGSGTFDSAQVHAINILRLHGESALRGKLEQIKATADLKAVARASGLVLPAGMSKARPSRTELISEIIQAAKHYDAQRSAATA